MTAVRRLAAVTGSVILAATGLTALTATPATAAVSCYKTNTKQATGVKITYSVCDNDNGKRRVTGTLTDIKEDGLYAVANVAIGGWSMGVRTGSSKGYSTGWQNPGKVGITIFRAD